MHYYRTIERQITPGDAARVCIVNRSGELTVLGEDRDDIALTAQASLNAHSAKEGQERLDAVDVPVHEEDGVTYIGAPQQDSHHIGIAMWGLRLNLLPKHDDDHVRLDIVLRVPRECAVRAEQRSGPLRVTGLQSSLEAEARTGPLEVRAVRGAVNLRARSGSVEVGEVTGDVSIDSRSGRVAVEHVAGDLDLRSRSGHAAVSDVSGDITLETQSGRIRFDGVAGQTQVRTTTGPVEFRGSLPTTLDIESHSGSVRLAVDHDAAFFIDAETHAGSIRSDLPVAEMSASRDGSPSVRVRTHSGAIRLAAR